MKMAVMQILVADDQPAVLEAVKLLLKSDGHTTVMVDSPKAVLQAASARSFDLILIDLNYARDTTSGQEGLDLLAALRSHGIQTPVVVMTAWGSVDLAVEAMRGGACDFVQKPWDNARLLETIHKQARQDRQTRTEMEIARSVQQKLLPRSGPAMRTLDYAGRCVPARVVGGDYFDFFDLGERQLGVLLADVSGKGVGAALLMASLQAAIRSRLSTGYTDAPSLLSAVNRQFFESSPTEQYATLFFARYDDDYRRLHYVNAGHLPPLLLHSDGGDDRLQTTAFAVGMFAHWDSEEFSVELQPGDRLMVFSDGVLEAGVDAGDEFGDGRIAECLLKSTGSAEDSIERLCAAVTTHCKVQHDDLTAVAACCR
jgi:phosphoserine phosphatase RsbU/P